MAKKKESQDKGKTKEKKSGTKRQTGSKGKASDKVERGKRSRSVRKDPVKVSQEAEIAGWNPKTELGRKIKEREILDIDEILNSSIKILESEVVDSLLTLEQDLLLIGQSKGKFGGGARRVFRQTQKKTREGNKPKFSTMAVVGDKDGHIGIGFGKAKETVPAREKAIRKAKLNVFKIRRGCGSWECGCRTPHSIPFSVKGKCGSVKVELMPAPKGKGLCCEKEIAKILSLSGIKDIWTKTRGQTKNKINFVYACEDALKKLVKTKVQPEHYKVFAIAEGSIGLKEADKDDVPEIVLESGKKSEPKTKPKADPKTKEKTEK